MKAAPIGAAGPSEGNEPTSEALAREALALARRGGDGPVALARRADAEIVLGRALAAEGKQDEAAAALRQAGDQARAISDRGLTAAALEGLGEVLATEGRFTEARVRFEMALDIHARTPNPVRARAALRRLRALAEAEERPDLAAMYTARLDALAADDGAPPRPESPR